MIRHIVLIGFRREISEATIAAIFDDVVAMKVTIPGVLAVTAGRSESPEHIERGFKHGFVLDLIDWGALQAYQQHPDHRAISASLIAHATGGLDGILVFDLPC